MALYQLVGKRPEAVQAELKATTAYEGWKKKRSKSNFAILKRTGIVYGKREIKDAEELIWYYKNNKEGLLPYQLQGV